MKRIISLALVSLMLSTTVACAKTEPAKISSSASAEETFLLERLGEIPEDIVLGDAATAAEYGVDMTDFEDDGYIIRTVGHETLLFGKTEDGLDRAVREYVKNAESGTTAPLNKTYHEGYRIDRLTVAGRDISEYTVYYPDTANENMRFAAAELVRLIKKATGAELTTVVGEPVLPAIELRHTDDPALKADGYRYKVTEDGLVIEGAVKRGCANGVWRFLQLECGWDRLIYGDSYLNEADHINIPVGTERSETPVFDYLGFYDGNDRVSNERTTPTAAQNSYPMTHPGGHGLVYGAFCDFNESKQICYTDEDRYYECYDNVRKYVAARYDSPDFFMVDIGQADNDNYCYCDNCLEVFLEEGGTNAGAVIRFVNRLSDEINEEFPGVYFAILAYVSAKKPPKVTKPNEHLIINFCYDFNCANHPVDGSKCTSAIDPNGLNNKDYDEIVRGWCEITDNFYVRNYGLNQHLLDFTMIDVIYDDIRYFRDLGVKGLLYEVQSYGLGTKRLEKQLVHEMNWNPDMTREEYDELFCELLSHEYGGGWKYIMEYMDEWKLAQSLTGCFHCWGWNAQFYPNDDKFNTHFYKYRFDYYMELMEAAANEADSARQQKKAELLSCSVIYMGCYSSYFLEYEAKNTERLAVFEERWARMLEILTENGYDIKRIPTLTANEVDLVEYSDTVSNEAWSKWYKRYERLVGKTLPEDAPIIEDKI